MYRFEILSDSNIKDLQILYKDSFDEDRSIEEIKNKFNTTSVGYGYISFLAYDVNDFPSAFYAIFPTRVRYNGQIYLCGQIGDLMTHSAHRRRGLFEQLANHSHIYAKEKGFKFIFTFLYKGAGSYNGFVNKLNFKDNNLNAYHIKIPILPMYRWLYPYHMLRKIYDFYIRLLQLLFFKHSGIVSKDDFNRNELVKDNAFYAYKSKFSIAKNILINGVRVYCKLKHDGALAIGDMQKTDYKTFKNTLKRIKLFCFLGGIRLIHFEVSEGSYFDSLLSKDYSSYNYYQLCTLSLDDTIAIDEIEFIYGDVDTF
jgi:hypothetical protein